MLKLKRSYCFDKKMGFAAWCIIFFIALMVSIVFGNSSNEFLRLFVRDFSVRFLRVTVIVVVFYPMIILISLTPTSASLKESNINLVRIIPNRNEKLFWSEVKPWLLVYPIMIVLSFMQILNSNVVYKDLTMEFFYILVEFLMIIIILIMGEMQVMSAIIFTFSREIKWYKTLIIYMFIDVSIISITMVSVYLLGINTTDSFMAMCILMASMFVVSLVMFMIQWRNIEKVNR